MFRRPAFRRLSVGAVALCVLVAGCTGGDDGPAEPDTRTTTGVTNDSVTVVAPSSASPEAIIGAAARFERANVDGGVNGRRIVFDGASEEGADSDAFAQLSAADTADAAAPVFGAPHNTTFCGIDDAFAVNGCQGASSDIWGTLVTLAAGSAEETGAMAVVVAREGVDAGPAVASFEAVGFDVDQVVVPADELADDLMGVAGIAEEIIAAYPDLVVHVGDANLVVPVGMALIDTGYEGPQTTREDYSPEFAAAASEAGLDGVIVLTDFAPFESADENPIVQRLIDDVREYEETEGLPETPLSGEVAAGYWSADAFLAALEATGSDLSVERFLQTANDNFEWRAEGTAGPATWPRNRDVPVPCGALVEVAGDGTFDVAVPYSCGRNLS